MRGSYKGKRSLIGGVVILMLIITATACMKPEDKMFEESDFAATVETVDARTWKTNEDIEITTGVINLTNRSAAVYHGSPLIHVQIYDERDQPQIEMLVTDSIGINGIAKPNEIPIRRSTSRANESFGSNSRERTRWWPRQHLM
jgi:hypothetical protein